jgi:ketosteroid isomerase-like protein
LPGSGQQTYPPDTQAQPAPNADEQSPPQQNTQSTDQQPAAETPAQNKESEQAEPPQVQTAPEQPQAAPARPQQPTQTTRRQAPPARPRPAIQQQQNGLGIQGVAVGEVTVGGGSIGKLRQDWQAAWNSRRLDDLMGLYADDAVLLSEGQRIMGKQAIRDYFQQELMRGKNHIVLNSISTYPAENLAYDDGTFSGTVEASNPSEGQSGAETAVRQVRGNYLTVVSKGGSGWVIREQAISGLLR